MSNRVHHAQLASRRTIARDTEEYVLRLSDAGDLRWRPGQFISVTVGSDEEQNPILRSYSIASSPPAAGASSPPAAGASSPPAAGASAPSLLPEAADAGAPPSGAGDLALTLILRLIPDGAGSAFFTHLQPGDPVRFTGPMGFFVNELAHDGDVVYAATGTGVAPILPMLRETLQRDEPGQVHLYWGLRGEPDLFWQDELAALAQHPRLQVHLYLSQPGAAWQGLRGRISAPVVDLLPALQRPVFYLCGNGHMIEEVKAALQQRGVNRKRQIRTEAFFD